MKRNTSSLSINPSKHTAVLPFEEESGAVLEKVRSALAGVVGALEVRRASELQKTLGLDTALSWGLFNAATTNDARMVAVHLPGERSMKRFFNNAQQAGVPVDIVERAAEAYEHFELVVQRHATDRDAFTAMVAGLGSSTSDDLAAIDIKNKRAVFRGNAALWGLEADSTVTIIIVHPSSTPTLMDTAVILGSTNFRQTRPGVKPGMRHIFKRDVLNLGEAAVTRKEAIDPREKGPESVALLRDFCSQPLPEFSRSEHPDHICHELTSRGIGKSAAMTVFTGFVDRASTFMPEARDEGEEFDMLYTIPSQLGIFDILMHESVWGDRLPDVDVYAYQGEAVSSPPRIPVSERVALLGRGIEVARTVELPRHVEMLDYVLRRVGWNPASFRVFRCRIEYPMIYTRVNLTFKNPRSGSSARENSPPK